MFESRREHNRGKPFHGLFLALLGWTLSMAGAPVMAQGIDDYTDKGMPSEIRAETPENSYWVTTYSTTNRGSAVWPMFGRDMTRKGKSNEHGARNGTYKWEYPTGGEVYSSPVGGPGSRVYVGSTDGKLYAFDKEGTLQWTFNTGASIYSAPAVSDDDGTIYIRSNKLFAVSSGGTLKWSYNTGADGSGYSSPAVDDELDVIYACGNKTVYALNKNGTLKWSCNTNKTCQTSPALGADRVFVAAGQYLYALWESNGSLAWSQSTNDDIIGSPAFHTGKGRVYVGSRDQYFYAFDSNGNKKWSYYMQEDLDSSPALKGDYIYVGAGNYLCKLKDNGSYASEVWSCDTGGWTDSSPAIDKNDYIYVGGDYDRIIAIKDRGGSYTVKWSYTTSGYVFSSPAILYGRIYVGSCDQRLYCFE